MKKMPSKAPTRKQLRKEQRKQKKARKNEYFSRGKHSNGPLPEKQVQPSRKATEKVEKPTQLKVTKSNNKKVAVNLVDQERKKEVQELATLKKKMAEQRKKQLMLANEEEDRNIKKLEKQLKLNKRKSKGLPKMFVESGLDYILEMCDPEQMKVIAAAEKKFTNMDDDFAEDLALITKKQKKSNNKPSGKKNKNEKESSDEADRSMSDDFSGGESNFSEEEMSGVDEEEAEFSNGKTKNGSMKRKRVENDKGKVKKKQKTDTEVLGDESDVDDFEEESAIEDEEESEIDDEDESGVDEEGSEMDDEEESEVSDEEESEAEDEEIDMEDIDLDDESDEMNEKKSKKNEKTRFKKLETNESDDDIEDFEDILGDEESDLEDIDIDDNRKKNVKKAAQKDVKKNKEILEKNNDLSDDSEMGDFEGETDGENEEIYTDTRTNKIKGAAKVNADGTWEDIYGRLHAQDGSLINKSNQKYIPPAVRAKMNQDSDADKETVEKRNRLKKQLKGLLNRLAISNMHNIAKQVENLYMNNSRNDMNETLETLINESIISQVLTPERLLMEHILLVAILHANIGTEVGAHFLQVLVSKFDEQMKSKLEVEDKTLDNIVIGLAQMYNFKIFDSKLMHEILNELGKEFTEKNVDCILHVLRNVGFVLRKDDPLALKNFILESHKKAANVTNDAVNGSRLKFLLDVLTAIKNNNMTKIPNYDDSYSEHLKKIMKGFIRKGNYVTQLNISLEDLLKAEERGKWWVVGSAWTGNSENREKPKKKEGKQKFSKELLEMARKMRMNTDTRRDIFCVVMSADGYDDAFEKLMHLGLTKNQEREIIHVILHCCVHENPFNPYYAYLAQKFCEYNRKYMLALKYSIWDKLKAIEKQSATCLSSLASLLIHLFLNEGLPISTLKVIPFSQMDGTNIRFLRQIFLGILLHNDTESCLNVFKNIAQSDKLKMFRESLRLFLQLFVRKNLKSDKIDEKQREMLKTRSKMIERLLVIKDTMNL